MAILSVSRMMRSEKALVAKYAIESHISRMGIPRDVETRLRWAVATCPVLVPTGARQTGKTCSLWRLFQRYGLVSLDLPTEAEQTEREPDAILGRRHAPDTLAVPVWETFAFAQLHHRKRLAGRAASLFFCLFFWRFVLVYRRK